jgi:MFS transporter, DHA2 family, multidrug resistance protein
MAVSGFKKAIIVITTVTAAIMELVDTSIVNVALSEISGGLGATIEDIAWVITSYAIANVIIIPMTGFLAEYFGRKNYYLFSMVLFTIASFMCGQSGTLASLVFWRFIQGLGGGALLSTSQSILFDAFEPKDRPIAAGMFGMGIVLGPTLGPTLGGYIIDSYSWPLIFNINIPIGILATWLTYTYVDKKPGEGTKRAEMTIDWWGIGLLAVGIGSLQYVLERGESLDWFSSESIRNLTVVAVGSLVGFVYRQLTTEFPVVNLRVLKNRTLAITTIFTFVIGVGLFTSVFIYPVLAQRILHFSPMITGLSLLPPTLSAVFLFPIIGKLMAKGVSPTPFIIIGFVFFILFGYLSSQVNAFANRWDFFIPLLMRGIGISMVQLPLINQAVAGLAPKDYASGIALNNMTRQLGGAFGIAMANNYVARQFAQHKSDLVIHTVVGNPLFDERVSNTVAGIVGKTGMDVGSATSLAYKNINFAVENQAYLLSYLDVFKMISLFFLCVLPLIVFVPSKKKMNADEAAAIKLAAEESH